MLEIILDLIKGIDFFKDISSWTFNIEGIIYICGGIFFGLCGYIKRKKELETYRLKSGNDKVEELRKTEKFIKLCQFFLTATVIIVVVLLLALNFCKSIKQFIKHDESKDVILADYICTKQRDRSILEWKSRQASISEPASTATPDLPKEPEKNPDSASKPTPEPEKTSDPTPKPTPTPEPEKTPDPTPKPTPTPEPERTPDPTPTPKPTPTPMPEIPDEDSVDLTF